MHPRTWGCFFVFIYLCAIAMAFPMPRLQPVTNAVLPSSLNKSSMATEASFPREEFYQSSALIFTKSMSSKR